MNWSFVRREWGAVTFVITVLIGVLVVPTALIIEGQGSAANQSPAVTSPASPARTATP